MPAIAQLLRAEGHEVHDDWFSAGKRADEEWQAHQQFKGLTLRQALRGPHARAVLREDDQWLHWCDTVVVIRPGRSAFIEMGVAVGRGREAYVYYTDGEPERWDAMLGYAEDVVYTLDDLVAALRQEKA